MPWFVLYTKSRSEKTVAKNLHQSGIDVYCPLRKTKRRWSDRTKMVEEPLFRSYCFVRLEEHQRAVVFGTPGVVGYLYWLKKPAVVQQFEIDLIKNMLNDFDHNLLEVLDVKAADRLRITSGVFMNQEGEVVSAQGKKIVVRLESLNICISIDSSRNKVEKLSTASALS